MLFNSNAYAEPAKDYVTAEGIDMILLNLDTTILPNIDMDQFGPSGEFVPQNRFEDHYEFGTNYEDVYPQGNKQFIRMFTISDITTQSEWKSKPVYAWNETDVRNWILETATNKRMNIAEIASFDFADVTGSDLIKMSKQTFSERMYSQTNSLDSILTGEALYDALQQLCSDSHYDQEAIVPMTVMDRFDQDDNLHGTSSEDCEIQLFDLDRSYKPEAIESREVQFTRGINCDSGYDSLSDEYEVKMADDGLNIDSGSCSEIPETIPTITKRPPGRPKGSGKKHPKRIKNVSVPEFLRDLLLSPKYCPKIIKWEDYSVGKFRFVRPDEVAKLWGGKRNNEKMSFEKFSRAMRYHYKQGVLVSVPTARLVYQFGPKAPQYVTPNPNFESTSGKFNMR